jgi:hypothetical protein
MIAVPAELPVTNPVLVTEATEGPPLVQEPPPTVLDKDVVPLTQIVAVPDIVPAFGSGLTVTFCVATTAPQPFVTVYDIVVVPALKPVTTPVEEFTVPTVAVVLLHTPPPVPLASRSVVASTHTVAVPLIVPGVANGFTVTTCVIATVPQPFVTV